MSKDGRAHEPLNESDFNEYNEFFFAKLTYLAATVGRLGACKDDALDAAQFGMAELLRHFPSVGRTEGERFTYAKRTAIREYFRQLKGAEKERRALAEADWVCPAPPRLTGDVDSEQRVLHLLRHLPPRQQAVMALSVDGYSPAEIADLLGMLASTVSSHLRHGLTALRAHLKQQQGPAGDQEGG